MRIVVDTMANFEDAVADAVPVCLPAFRRTKKKPLRRAAELWGAMEGEFAKAPKINCGKICKSVLLQIFPYH